MTFGFFTKGTFHLHAPFSSTSIAQSSIHSRTSFPGPLSIRRFGSTCYDEKPVLRSYTSFTQAADENAISRVYVGFHFRNATAEGTAYGRKIGERAATLLPAAK